MEAPLNELVVEAVGASGVAGPVRVVIVPFALGEGDCETTVLRGIRTLPEVVIGMLGQ